MSEEATPVDGGAPEGSASETVGVVSGESASAGDGNAPVAGDDARGGEGEEGAEATPPAQLSEFQILNRKFRDQKHAEEVLGSEIGAKRGLQRQNADLTKRLERYESELDDLRSRLRAPGGGSNGKGSGQGSNAENETFVDHLVKSGDLQFFNELAKNDQIGVGGAILEALKAKEDWDSKHRGNEVEELRSEIQQGEMRREAEATMGRAFTAAKSLISDFPELDDVDAGAPDEAHEARQEIHAAILGYLQSTPPALHPRTGEPVPSGVLWLASKPEQAIRWAVSEFRREYGTPVFAQEPGTSDSPSARAAAAAEKKAAASAAEPMDGSGIPRQNQGKPGKKGLEAEWREGLAQMKGREAKTPSGRGLGFSAT